MPKRILSGVVISSNSNKTITVSVTRRIKHKLYKKIIRQSKNIMHMMRTMNLILVIQYQ